jgi:hypothetical protein
MRVLFRLAVGCALLIAAERLNAQNAVTITITGGASSPFPPPAASDFGSYAYNPTALTFTAATTNGSPVSQTWIVQICANNASATLGNGKPLSDLEWTPNGLNAYRPLGQNNDCNSMDAATMVVNSVLTPVGGNASVSGGVLFRMRLNVSDAGPTYGTTLKMFLTVTSP